MSHPNEPIDKIVPFLHAQKVLEYLADQEIFTAYAQLYHDGSGRLVVREFDKLTSEVQDRVSKRLGELLHSRRWEFCGDGSLILTSCCGWHP